MVAFERTLRSASSCAEEDDVLPVMQSADLQGMSEVSNVPLHESTLEEEKDEQRFALLLAPSPSRRDRTPRTLQADCQHPCNSDNYVTHLSLAIAALVAAIWR